MKKPNIIFLIIDSFRSDKFYGDTKKLKNLFLNDLINRGSYFSQAVSASDGTILSWSSIFTGKFPFKTGIRSLKYN